MTTAVRGVVQLKISYDEQGNIVDVVGLGYRGLAQLHDWLGNHRVGCDNDNCPCWAAGYQAALERRRGE